MKGKELGCSCGILACLLMIIICFIKCSSKDVSEEASYGFIKYILKWDQTLSDHKAPERIRYCFYPADKGAMMQIESDSTGLQFTLPPDKYRLLVFNCDADNISFRNMESFETAEAYIPATKAIGCTTSAETAFYGSVIDNLVVEANNGQVNEEVFTLAPLIREVTLNIKVDGMEHVKSCNGALTGVPVAFNLSKQTIVPDKVTTVNFESTPSAKGIKTKVLILGTPSQSGSNPPALPSNEVKLDFTLTDGSTASSTIDLENSIAETEGPKVNVDITVTVAKNATFSITVKKWEVTAGDSMVIE